MQKLRQGDIDIVIPDASTSTLFTPNEYIFFFISLADADQKL